MGKDMNYTVKPNIATSQIDDEAITTAKIDDKAVTTAKIADEAVDNSKLTTKLYAFTATLNGNTYSPINFTEDTPATTSTGAGTFDFTGVGDGGTILITPDAGAEQTATINATAGSSVSGATASTDISLEADTNFNISVNGDTAETVTLDNAGKTSGALIATEMQTKIQALGGEKAGVTVTYNDVVAGKYAIVSSQLGTGSSVVITPAPTANITEELELGTADGGLESAGTGDVEDLSAVTATEIVTVCDSDMTGLTATVDGDAVKFTSATDGKDSKLVIGAGTLNTALTLTQADEFYGSQNAGLASAMADTSYFTVATLNEATTLTSRVLSITDVTTAGFNLRCETTGATDDVDILVISA